MKKLFISLAIVLALAVCGEASAQQSCLSAMDCPGGQLCQMGKCVAAGGAAPAPAPAPAPVPAPAPAPAPGGCATDIDCPGNQVCQNGACVEEQPPPPSMAPIPGAGGPTGYGSPEQATPTPSGYGAPSGYGTEPSSPGGTAPAGGMSSGFTPPAEEQEGLKVTSGSMQLGGRLALRYEHLADDDGYVNGAQVEVLPELGYFVMDNFELMFGLILAKGFGEYYEEVSGDGMFAAPMDLGLYVGLRYLFEAGAVYFYLGAMIGFEVYIYEEDEIDPYKWLLVGVELGLMIPLNYHVAIDIGVRPQYSHGLEDHSLQYLNAPLGYLGVQGFF